METKTLTVSEEKIREAMSQAKTEESKEIIRNLFPEVSFKMKPTLDDYTTITSYEDACEALEEYPLFSVDRLYIWDGDGNYISSVPEHIIALMKLETISRALWGVDWEPKPDAEGSKMFYWPYVDLWKEGEIRDMDDTEKGTLLSANVDASATAGFGCLSTGKRSSFACAYFGFRLCQETEEKARYFGSRHFVKLWAEYLRFNFETGDFIAQV